MTYPSVPQPAYGYGGPPTLDQPLRGASIGQAFGRFWKKYATFSGRASRSEYWWVVLISVIVSIVILLIGLALAGGDFAAMNANATGADDILNGLWGLATLVPSLAIAVRRLHDTNRSGWWLLIGLIPLVGAIILIVWNASGPVAEGARFDAAPGR